MTGHDKKNYSIIYENIRELVRRRDDKKSKLTISLSFILDQKNYKHIFQMIEVAERLKVDEITFHNFLPSPIPGFTAEERCLYADNQDVIKTFSQVMHASYKIKINLPALLDKSKKEKNCKTYFRLIRIDGEGNVGGCATQLLNLDGNGKFYDDNVWNNSHFRERRRLFLDPSLPDLPPCKDCCANYGSQITE
jgi:MoaA/NifB/PqqE/SkfB family radical SAM enzyme